MLNYIFSLLFFPILLLFFNCKDDATVTTESKLPVGEGVLSVEGGNIWYKVSGEGSDADPLVLLHGGPGASSQYLEPLEALGRGLHSRSVIRYDQLGCGKSDRVTDTTLFTIERYVAELEALRVHLGVDSWHINGHSWGSMLALEYYRAYPEHVSSLILASPCISTASWIESTNQLLTTLPDSLQEAVRRAEITGDYSDPSYVEAMNVFYGEYVFGNVSQAKIDAAFAGFSNEVYGYMWGPSEFSVSGTLATYDAVDLLPDITVPVLFTVGEFDEIKPEIVKEQATLVPDAKVVVLDDASHMTTLSAREENIRAVRNFTRSVETD